MVSFILPEWTCTYTVRSMYSQSTNQTKARQNHTQLDALPPPTYTSPPSPSTYLHASPYARPPSEFQPPWTRQTQNGRPTRRRSPDNDTITTRTRAPAAIAAGKRQERRGRDRCDAQDVGGWKADEPLKGPWELVPCCHSKCNVTRKLEVEHWIVSR